MASFDDIQPSRINKAATWNWTTAHFQRNGVEIATLNDINAGVVNVTGTATDYVLLSSDYYIGVSNTSAPRTMTLPASPAAGKVYIIKDESGGAATNNITINGNGHNVDGSSTFVIDTNYGSVELVYRNNWFIN